MIKYSKPEIYKVLFIIISKVDTKESTAEQSKDWWRPMMVERVWEKKTCFKSRFMLARFMLDFEQPSAPKVLEENSN